MSNFESNSEIDADIEERRLYIIKRYFKKKIALEILEIDKEK